MEQRRIFINFCGIGTYTFFITYLLKAEVPQSALIIEMVLIALLLEGFLQVSIPANHCIVLCAFYSSWLQLTKGGPAELPGGPQSHEMLWHFLTKSSKARLTDTPNWLNLMRVFPLTSWLWFIPLIHNALFQMWVLMSLSSPQLFQVKYE